MATELPLLFEKPNESDYLRPGKWWHSEGERIICDLCPRHCALKEGDRGFCFVRQNLGQQMVLTTYGRSTGFCIDPIEKKPLNHFFPGTSVLSFGTAGCNLGCRFCQNWDISKSREIERLSNRAFPEDIARAAQSLGCRSVAFTYNDPVIWAEYAIETAKACHAVGIKTVAVTAGYITKQARGEFYEVMDAANVDLKAFTEEFYHKLTLSHLQPVLDTLRWLKEETNVWFEITNLIIPDANDNADELKKLCDWVLQSVGDEVPVHFTAFHPDFRMMDRPRTPPETLNLARDIALQAGLKFVYTGNVDDVSRQSTFCPNCGQVVIERNWYQLGVYELDGNFCRHCGFYIPGHFEKQPGTWGRKRARVDMRQFASAPAPLPAVDPKATPSNPSPTQAERNKPMTASTEGPLQLTEPQQQALLSAAAAHIYAACTHSPPMIDDPELTGLGSQIVHGIYVSLKRKGQLRGCCGFFGRQTSIKVGLEDAAFRTATNDVRFPPVSLTELPFLDLEVWLLEGPQKMEEEGEDRMGAVVVGRDGLHISLEDKSGLLLPGVPVENGWDSKEFLTRVCLKANLPPTAWKDDAARLFKFKGQSFRGKVVNNGNMETYLNTPPIYTPDQMHGYRQFALNTLTSLLMGATPMFYCPTIPDSNINGLFLAVQISGANQEIMASRWSLTKALPLQSTLFGICEELARSLQRHRITSLDVDLALIYDTAMHGTVADSDLQGIDPRSRSVLVVERSRSGWFLDNHSSAQKLVEESSAQAQITDPASAQVFSFATQSTRNPLKMASVPRPRTGPEDRQPSVAGKFYPDDPQEVSSMLDDLLAGEPVEKRRCSAVMVPHAGWKFSGKIAAHVLKHVEIPKTIIAIGPKHTPYGVEWAVAPHRTWVLPGGNVASDLVLARKLVWAIPGLQLDAAAHQQEHGIEVELPLIARLSPETRVLGITIGSGTLQRCEEFAEGLAKVLSEMEDRPLLLISSDMNHFANDVETRRLDEMALAELDRLDPDSLFHTVRDNHISMCGVLPAVIILKTLKRLDALHKSERAGYATTFDTTGDPSRVVGYAGMWFE